MDGWMDGWMDRWIDGWIDGLIATCTTADEEPDAAVVSTGGRCHGWSIRDSFLVQEGRC